MFIPVCFSTGDPGAAGSQGPKGDTGLKGEPGKPGAAGQTDGLYRVLTENVSFLILSAEAKIII